MSEAALANSLRMMGMSTQSIHEYLYSQGLQGQAMSAPCDDTFQSQTHANLKETVMITTKTTEALAELTKAAGAAANQRASLDEIRATLTTIAGRDVTFSPDQRRLVHAAVAEVFGEKPK